MASQDLAVVSQSHRDDLYASTETCNLNLYAVEPCNPTPVTVCEANGIQYATAQVYQMMALCLDPRHRCTHAYLEHSFTECMQERLQEYFLKCAGLHLRLLCLRT